MIDPYTMLLYTITSGRLNKYMKSESEKLGNNLKRIRTKKGVTQGNIARSLGVSRSFVSNIENGKTNPTLATISKLAKALGIPSDELLK